MALSESMLTCPNSSLLAKFNPGNIKYMPVVEFIECLDFEQTAQTSKLLTPGQTLTKEEEK